MRCAGSLFPAVFGGLFLAACDSTGPGVAECLSFLPVTLGVGEHTIVEPQPGLCVSLPPAGAPGAEHLYLPVATEGRETNDGVSAPYAISGIASGTAATARSSPLISAFQGRLPPDAFHSLLRARERDLSRQTTLGLFGRGRVGAAPPPVVGDQGTFDVCATTACRTFVSTTATVRAVGDRVAVYVDNAAPAGGYTDADLVDVAALFDDHLYPIGIAAFGRESDIDANGVVIVLLTQRVNALSPDCNATESVILGYFFGADLLPRGPNNLGSNEAEIFYGLVPDPDNPDCSVTEAFALSHLPSTFVHEFQHMISFNQHRLVRGAPAEDTWLNEGLSHFAEELAGLQVPDSECPVSGSCANDFLAQGDLVNAFAYLESPEDFFLIEPGSSSGKLEERGANWLFVRWLVDHFATDSLLGNDLTQRLVATNLVGVANVAAQTGVSFSTLVSEWQLTNYLDDLPGFSQPSARLRYKTWNFREVAEANSRAYPLVPDSMTGANYSHVGMLRAGSGKHVLVLQPANSGPVDFLLWGGVGEPFPSVVDPQVAVVRIR